MIMKKYRKTTKTQKKLDFNGTIGYILCSKPAEPLPSMLNSGGYFFAQRGCCGI